MKSFTIQLVRNQYGKISTRSFMGISSDSDLWDQVKKLVSDFYVSTDTNQSDWEVVDVLTIDHQTKVIKKRSLKS